MSLAALTSCAVGPDFAPPPAPPVAGYTPDRLGATSSAPVPGGEAQNFALGRDIPGEWWKVFHSREIDALVAEALRSSPTVQAAQAALWQAKENLYAQGGVLLPTADATASATRQAFSRLNSVSPGRRRYSTCFRRA